MNVYGIPNCDTVKKGRKFLESAGIEHNFIDLKKLEDFSFAQDAFGQLGEALLNKRAPSWRGLDDATKAALSSGDFSALPATPTVLKRPLVFHNGRYTNGFDEARWTTEFLN